MVAVAAIGSAVVGAGASMYAGSKAAKAAAKGADASAQTQMAMYEQNREDFAPLRKTGNRAIESLAGLYGVGSGADGGAVDWEAYVRGNPDAWEQWQRDPNVRQQYSQDLAAFGRFHYTNDGARRDLSPYTTSGMDIFKASPGYEFRKQEGLDAIKKNTSARGLLGSTATKKMMDRYAEGNAASEFEAFGNRLAAMAGVGQAATNSTAASGSAAASGVAQAQQGAGAARASAYTNMGSAINNGVQNLASAYMYGRNGGFGGGGMPADPYNTPPYAMT